MERKLWDIHTMEKYSAIKRNEPLIHTTTKMNLKTIILCERSQTKKEYILFGSIYIKL